MLYVDYVVGMYLESLKYNPNHCRLDLYFASNEMRPLLVGDFKLDDFEYAKVQTFGYCMAIVNEACGIPFIAMPCTRKQFVMYVCFSEFLKTLYFFLSKCLKQTPKIAIK